MRTLTSRKVYDTPGRNYFGWDLRKAADWRIVLWKRTPRLSAAEIEHWPYRTDDPKDLKADFTITVQGDPSDELLTFWLREEELGQELSSVAKA